MNTNFEILIAPGKTEKDYWKDLWRFRELFYILSWRDIKVRYKQTAIGAAWSILRPLLTTVIFTIVFSRVAKLNNPGNAPYALMVFAGLLPWQFFSNSLTEASNSLISNTNLITKVYFPRMIIPASAIITSFVDFAISFVLLLLMMFCFGLLPSWHIIFLPVFVVMAFFTAFGIGLYLTAVNVKYRDFRYIIPFIVQFGLYITPVGFSSSIIDEKYRIWFSLNPMVGIIDGFRWSILNEPFYMQSMIFSILITFISMLIGVKYFRKVERSFADNI